MLYNARKEDGAEMYIDPFAIKQYYDLGYTIIKMVEEEVTDIEYELKMISPDIKMIKE